MFELYAKRRRSYPLTAFFYHMMGKKVPARKEWEVKDTGFS